MKLVDLKKQKHLLYVFILVGILGTVLLVNSFLGEGLIFSSVEQELEPQQDYFGAVDEAEDSSVPDEEDIADSMEDIAEKPENTLEGTKEENKEVTNVEASKVEASKIKPEETIESVQNEKTEEKNEATNNNPVSTPTAGSPITGNQYVVKNNDTLFHIAQRANVSVENLKSLNNLNSDVIMVGQILAIKGSNPANDTSTDVASRGTREEDLYWLSRIIHAEAQGEPYVGKVAVGNVILNRVKSSDFPNSIYGVVFDRQFGYTQFSPVLDGSINNTPNADSINAARDALNGQRPVGEALYFLNPRKATNFWIVHNRKLMQTIGDHDFYY